jgi:hypothetical protein
MDLSGEVGGVCLGIDAQHSIGTPRFATARGQSGVPRRDENRCSNLPSASECLSGN